jgi:hypothetical protein
MSDILETNSDRKNRKNAEKMNIRVEGSSSEEGDGRWNRIAAPSAKCKENKARWDFYQGQDYILTRLGQSSQNNLRVSTGFVLKF